MIVIPAHEIVENRFNISAVAIAIALPANSAGSFSIAVDVAVLILLVAPPLQEYSAEDPVLLTLHMENFEGI